jgi:triacylglycerol esterase/lipase EstA (alpha/beta hydrolase family)
VLDTLSPQRRRLVTLLVALALAVLVAVAVLVVARGGAGRSDQARPGPVILVPGYGGQLSSLDDIAARLRRAGRTVLELPLPDGGTGDLHGQADALDAAVQRELGRGAPSVDLVGYSAGGVVVRLWASEGSNASHVRRVVTIGTPSHGTEVAGAAGLLLGGACAGACAQLEPDSDLLDRLNEGDETPAGPDWVSLWSNADQTVVPPDSARLVGADNITVQSVCASDAVSHSQEPRDPAVIGLVVSALGTGSLPRPTTADCAALRRLGG